MELSYKIHPLYEACVFLEKVAMGETVLCVRDRLLPRVADKDSRREFLSCCEPLIGLEERLNSLIDAPLERISFLFRQFGTDKYDLTCPSLMSIIFSSMLYNNETLDGALKEINEFSDKRRMACIVDAWAEEGKEYSSFKNINDLTLSEFVNFIGELCIDESEKWRMMELYRSFNSLCDEGAQILRPIVEEFERGNKFIDQLLDEFKRDFVSTDDVKSKICHLLATHFPEHSIFRPLICGFNWSCALYDKEGKNNHLKIYIGVLQHKINTVLSESNYSGKLSRTMHILGDQSKFDILLFLKDNEAYGQTIANKFKFSSATISQHMAKLAGEALVTSNVVGNKSYYSINKNAIRQFIDMQRHVFLDE